MLALWTALLCLPLLDLALKSLMLRRLKEGAIRLGPLGELRIVRSQIWLMRLARRPALGLIWGGWMLSLGGLLVVTHFIPSSGLFAGALLGGALSHVWETSARGYICDYVRLRFWPAFNLADVAITAGAIGLAWTGWARVTASFF